MFELSRVKLYRKCSEGTENCFELAEGSSYRGGSSYRESTVLESYYDSKTQLVPDFHLSTIHFYFHCLPWSYVGKLVSAREKSAEQRGTECSNKRD